jgi:hypothetical protein
VAKAARLLEPAVWVAQLRDVGRWWRQKAGFGLEVSPNGSGWDVRFDCAERATVLVRYLESDAAMHRWDDTYQVLEGRALHVAGNGLPFVGVSPDAPAATISFLKEQGYIVEACERARRCTVWLDAATLSAIQSEVELIEHIESSPAPLVKFGRWPDEARSALCVTGDLDAVSLIDYLSRLLRL